MPMLVLTGEKAGGEFLIEQAKLVADNVEGVDHQGLRPLADGRGAGADHSEAGGLLRPLSRLGQGPGRRIATSSRRLARQRADATSVGHDRPSAAASRLQLESPAPRTAAGAAYLPRPRTHTRLTQCASR